jgi:hypothetical protein
MVKFNDNIIICSINIQQSPKGRLVLPSGVRFLKCKANSGTRENWREKKADSTEQHWRERGEQVVTARQQNRLWGGMEGRVTRNGAEGE